MKLPNLKILPFIFAGAAFLTLSGCDGTIGTPSDEPLSGSIGASTPAVSVDINDLSLGYIVTGTSIQGEENNSSIEFICLPPEAPFDGDSFISWNGVSYYNIVGDVIAWIPEEADMNLSTADGGTPGRLEVGATYFLEGPGGPNENWTILDIQKTDCQPEI